MRAAQGQDESRWGAISRCYCDLVIVRCPRGLAHSPQLIASALAVLTGAALALTGSAQPAFASVSPTPASGTPELATTGTTQQVRQIVQCGQTMYAVGSFTLISRAGTT